LFPFFLNDRDKRFAWGCFLVGVFLFAPVFIALRLLRSVSMGKNMKKERSEGPKARKKFERAMTALFQVPKSEITEKIKKKSKKGKD
jgi:hypothetical protein